jgi:hypothetical protein
VKETGLVAMGVGRTADFFEEKPQVTDKRDRINSEPHGADGIDVASDGERIAPISNVSRERIVDAENLLANAPVVVSAHIHRSASLHAESAPAMATVGDSHCPSGARCLSFLLMVARLQNDLERLGALAFHRLEWAAPDIRRYQALRNEEGDKAVAPLDVLYRWMFVPITLWPINVHQVFAYGLAQLSAGKPLDKEMLLLLEVLPAPPHDKVCEVVARHEHDVQRGHYEELVTTTAKFDAEELVAARNSELKEEWKRIKDTWDVDRFRDGKGVIRRTLSAERNLRQPFSVDWKKRAERFQAVFDAFCFRWNLYGMQGDRPLLMKLSVNLTPHGTMILIPAYWSFDAKRDVRWDALMQLHRARAPRKQGAALAEGVEHRRAMATKLKALDAEAKRLRLRGAKRHAFLCKGLGLVEATDPKRLSRLRREFED